LFIVNFLSELNTNYCLSFYVSIFERIQGLKVLTIIMTI